MTATLRTRRERDTLVERYLPLVRHVVARLPITLPATLDRDDLCSAGTFGLIHAAEGYDPDRGASFKTFAYTAIRGAVLDEVRRHDPLPRGRRDRLRAIDRSASELHVTLGREPTLDELASSMGVPTSELEGDLAWSRLGRTMSLDELTRNGEDDEPGCVRCTEPGPVHHAEVRDDVAQLTAAIAELPEQERRAVVLYHYERLYLKEIGDLLGVSESRVSQILTRATARLRLRTRDV